MSAQPITLTDGTTTLQLDPDLFWGDEHDWHPVEQSTDRTLTGALIVQVAARQAGRPITLKPADNSSAWMPRATLTQLRAWAAIPGKTLTLTLYGTAYQVLFRHHDAPALSAEPVVFFSDPLADDWHLVTLKFLTAE